MLKYHNDGKERCQSHEIYDNDYDIPYGYGSTKEEAFDEYKRNVEEYSNKLLKLKENLNINNSIKVDCMGNVIV